MARVARELNLGTEDATRSIREVVTILSGPPVRGAIQGAYRFIGEESGFGLWHGDRRVLSVNADLSVGLSGDGLALSAASLELSRSLRGPEAALRTRGDRPACVRLHHGGEAPRLRRIERGRKNDDGQGVRGRGGSPRVRGFLVFSRAQDRAEVFLDSEEIIRAWARDVAAQLLASPPSPILVRSPHGGLHRRDTPPRQAPLRGLSTTGRQTFAGRPLLRHPTPCPR